jgi:glycosyltransferase involved in cell wall biosynthesis
MNEPFAVSPERATPYRLSVIMSTFNRCDLLPRAIRSLFVESTRDLFEVIVVDNGSTDGTAETVRKLRAEGFPLRRVLEPRKGVGFTRNAGVAASRAPCVALMDDDQEAYPGWAASIVRTFDARPDLAFLAGPVEPLWIGEAPDWITPAIQGAVSIIEWGGEPKAIDPRHWMCVPGGNSAYRRDVVNALGGWRSYRRSQDREFTVRLLLAGYHGLYVPAMRMRHRVRADRINRDYFRRWNETEGRMRAGYRFEELFDRDGHIHPAGGDGRRLAGVPLYLYRRALGEFRSYVTAMARRSRVEAFEHELKLRYLWNYIRARVTDRDGTQLAA